MPIYLCAKITDDSIEHIVDGMSKVEMARFAVQCLAQPRTADDLYFVAGDYPKVVTSRALHRIYNVPETTPRTSWFTVSKKNITEVLYKD